MFLGRIVDFFYIFIISTYILEIDARRKKQM